MMKCKDCQQEFTSERVWHTHRCPGRKPKRISPDCDADHCTPEERAVIEAAITLRQTQMPIKRITEHELAWGKFKDTVRDLLAARAGKETE